jgi:hypothetical protein
VDDIHTFSASSLYRSSVGLRENKVVLVSLISLQAFISLKEALLQDDIRPSNLIICFLRRIKKLIAWSSGEGHRVGIDIRRWDGLPSVRIPEEAREFSLLF